MCSAQGQLLSPHPLVTAVFLSPIESCHLAPPNAAGVITGARAHISSIRRTEWGAGLYRLQRHKQPSLPDQWKPQAGEEGGTHCRVEQLQKTKGKFHESKQDMCGLHK